MSFTVKLGAEIIGVAELEGGDPPMGVAFGRMTPTAVYSHVKAQHAIHEEIGGAIPGLTVEDSTGTKLECSGGVQIADYSEALGENGLQVFVYGIPYRRYEELFPHHVDAYKKQFS
jgi:hypothetical protein